MNTYSYNTIKGMLGNGNRSEDSVKFSATDLEKLSVAVRPTGNMFTGSKALLARLLFGSKAKIGWRGEALRELERREAYYTAKNRMAEMARKRGLGFFKRRRLALNAAERALTQKSEQQASRLRIKHHRANRPGKSLSALSSVESGNFGTSLPYKTAAYKIAQSYFIDLYGGEMEKKSRYPKEAIEALGSRFKKGHDEFDNSACIAAMEGDVSDPPAFCRWLEGETIGKYESTTEKEAESKGNLPVYQKGEEKSGKTASIRSISQLADILDMKDAEIASYTEKEIS